ncbi:MAG TPA: hypothetical protein VIJ44_08530 [Acidimicrobiia bacterium]|jgi:hypothetical protein
MSGPRRRKPPPQRSRRRRAASARDFWGSEPTDDPPADVIAASDDPTVMIRSLGPPPFPGNETIAEHYFAATYDKAAALAVALAAASGLLATEDPTPDA